MVMGCCNVNRSTLRGSDVHAETKRTQKGVGGYDARPAKRPILALNRFLTFPCVARTCVHVKRLVG